LTAAKFDEPLLQLHVGRLMGKYLGDSESALESALAAARAARPCVLWIDELEKAVGGFSSGEGGGTGGRLLGTLLTWMQENRDVFVVATANSIETLPPELLRRGRFDEHFVIDLPNEEERAEIVEHKLSALGTLDEALAAWIAKGAKDYSGSDLEGLVAEAARRAQLRRRTCAPVREDFEPLLKGDFRPQAVQLGDQHKKLKESVDKYKFRPASAPKSERPFSAHRAAAEPPLAPVLARLLGERAEVVVRWSGGTLHFFSYGEQRRARLGPKGVNTVADGFERETYRVRREGEGLVLDGLGGRRPDVPARLVLGGRGGVEVDGTGAVCEAVQASGSLPPELWEWLGGHLNHRFGSFVLVGSGKGAERRIVCGRDADTPLVTYRVEIHANTLLLVPEHVTPFPSWAPPSDEERALMQGVQVCTEGDSVRLAPACLPPLSQPAGRTWINRAGTLYELYEDRLLFVLRNGQSFAGRLVGEPSGDATCARWFVLWENSWSPPNYSGKFEILRTGECRLGEGLAQPTP
jgi:hypothetical protein